MNIKTLIPILLFAILLCTAGSAPAQSSIAACRPSDPDCNSGPHNRDDDDIPCAGPPEFCNPGGGTGPGPGPIDSNRFRPRPTQRPLQPWRPDPNAPDAGAIGEIMRAQVESMSWYQLSDLRGEIKSIMQYHAGSLSELHRQALYDKLVEVEREIRMLELNRPVPPPGPPPPPPPPLW